MERQMSRRQVLTALGAIGGAGMVLGSLGALDLYTDGRRGPFTRRGRVTSPSRDAPTSVDSLGVMRLACIALIVLSVVRLRMQAP